MKNLSVILAVFFISITSLFASGNNDVLPSFDRLTTSDGLYSNNIMHIIELADGRMVITNHSCVNIYDGSSIKQHHADSPEIYHLDNYKGYYHVYADENDRLWVKNTGTVWCMDLSSGKIIQLDHIIMTDLFVDNSHKLWIVNDTVVDNRIRFEREWGELQDLECDSLCLYLFFSSSKLACYDKQTSELKYITQPYDTAEAKYYDKTSLVVCGKDRCFYQLRCGEDRYVFLKFNPSTREWSTVFETNTGAFHTLCIPNEELALISCPQGLWEINLETGGMTLRSEFMTTDGDTIKTGFNTVFCDHLGRLWLGTYNEGVLYADGIHASESHITLYVIIALILLLLLLIVAFRRYAILKANRERKLMQRLRELTMASLDSNKVADREIADNQAVSDENPQSAPDPKDAENSEFIMKAVALVKQNINTPGYSVERLATDLCMERTGLYKKLTTLLDKTPSLFMRSIRLEHAAQLLKEGNLSIAEIAEQTGFSSSSYFSKQFQEIYGCKPSEYK